MRNGFAEALFELAAEDSSICLLTGDLGYSVLEKFEETYPNRYFNMGVAEQNMIGVAAGLALAGMRPIVYSIANFCTFRCLEQIRNDICYPNLPVTIVGVGGGFAYSTQGFTHIAAEDIAVMRSLPGMQVIVPADKIQAQLMTRFAVLSGKPSYLRLEKSGESAISGLDVDEDLTKPSELKSGNDVLILACGTIVSEALKAATKAENAGVSTGVWNVPFLNPLHQESFERALQKFKLILTVEEHQLNGGLGTAVSEIVAAADNRTAKVVRLGLPNQFVSKWYSQKELRKAQNLDSEAVFLKIMEHVSPNKQN